jgi:glutamyl-Q tRNA(Asp) synthetase
LASQPIFRFAPSPNGHLHLGHAYSALFANHWAKKLGGVCLLRIEDIDTARCRPEFVAQMREDLDWLGLVYPEPVRRQSEHFEDYRAAAERLRAEGLLYPCFCTRSEIRARAEGRADPDGAPLYPGTCRELGETERAERLAQGHPVQWRLDGAKAMAWAGALEIAEQDTPASAPRMRPAAPERWGDVVLVRKDTPTSYHLSVVVDDALQGVSHVTRGMDLYAATDIHCLVQAALGLGAPLYCHHGLIVDDDAEKLSKSRGSESLRDLRAAGWSARDVRARLGF